MILFISDDPFYKQLSIAVFIVAAITDWYDGWLARKFNYITASGKFLDPLADKILTSTAFFAFVYLDVLELWMVLVIVIRDFLITFLRFYAEVKNKSINTIRIAKWKTFLQMAFIYYLLCVFVIRTVDWIYKGNERIFSYLTNPDFIFYSMLVVTLFTLFTGIAYLIKNHKLIKSILTFEA